MKAKIQRTMIETDRQRIELLSLLSRIPVQFSKKAKVHSTEHII